MMRWVDLGQSLVLPLGAAASVVEERPPLLYVRQDAITRWTATLWIDGTWLDAPGKWTFLTDAQQGALSWARAQLAAEWHPWIDFALGQLGA